MTPNNARADAEAAVATARSEMDAATSEVGAAKASEAGGGRRRHLATGLGEIDWESSICQAGALKRVKSKLTSEISDILVCCHKLIWI